MSKYFVSYFWKTLLKNGSGMCILEAENGMETVDGLLEVQEAIKEENGFRKCVIINYKKLGDSDAEKQAS